MSVARDRLCRHREPRRTVGPDQTHVRACLDTCRSRVVDIVQAFDVHMFEPGTARARGSGQMSAMVLTPTVGLREHAPARVRASAEAGSALRLTARGRRVVALLALVLALG